MATNKATSNASYAIRFNAASMRDSSDDETADDHEGNEGGISMTFSDPLLAPSLARVKSSPGQFSKKLKKKVDVVKLETKVEKRRPGEQGSQVETLDSSPGGIKKSEEDPVKGKTSKTKSSLIKPLSVIRKKHSSSLLSQPQSAPSSELSSPTTSSRKPHVALASSVVDSNFASVNKNNASVEMEKDSKILLASSSDVSLNSNINNCNNKDDMFSIFSGLKDKLVRVSAESREILDRKVFKTSSVDVPKITSMFASSPIEGELLSEEAKEETLNGVYLASRGSGDKVSDIVRQSSNDGSIASEPLETEMTEFSPRSASEGETSDSFDISRLMKLVQSESGKKHISRNSTCEERKLSLEENDNTWMDDNIYSLDAVMTPSDILSHEAAVGAFRSSASSLLDPSTRRLPESGGSHSKLVKKSSVSGSPIQKNPFLSEKKETISKSSSISMTLSSLLSRQKSSSKLPAGTSLEAIVMTSKSSEIKENSPSEKATPSKDCPAADVDVTLSDDTQSNSDDIIDQVFLQESDWCFSKHWKVLRKTIFSRFVCFLVAFLAWLCVPLPPYTAGIITGVIGTLVINQGINIFSRLFSSTRMSKTVEHLSDACESVICISDGDESLDIRESRNLDGSFKGWLNELGSGSKSLYDPRDYHLNSTHSVYATLEGTNLRLQTPRLSTPKRALWSDESPTSVTFARQRHYDLLGSKVSLLPENLVPKRLWSKKYPVYIEITKVTSVSGPALKSRSDVTKITPQSEDTTSSGVMSSQTTATSCSTSSQQKQSVVTKKVLYLFARTSREKEEWFRRLGAASLGHPWPTRFSDIVQNIGVSQQFKRKTHRRAASQPNKKSITENDGSSDVDNIPVNPNNTCDTSTDGSNNQTPNTIDYSLLDPELNLLYYAQYMSRKRNQPNVDPASTNKTSSSTERDGSNKRSALIGGTSPQDSNAGASRSKETSKMEKSVDATEGKLLFGDDCEPQLMWLNTLVSRCFMDFLREKYWVEKMKEKIQKKLSKIHIPFIMDQLSVTGIDLGSNVPTICTASRPYLDDRGFWVDLGVSYSGGFCITMETKCNLMKLKHSQGSSSTENSDSTGQLNQQGLEKRLAALYSDEEDSAESSTDEENRLLEEDLDDTGEDKKLAQPIGKRLLRLVDKISQSRYFQQATDYKYIRRAIEEVSNTRLELNVEVKSLVGTLAINVPPPPTDRLWYGFRGNPQFDLVARPRVGVRQVSLSPVTEWIEKKLAIEFQRVFVMPNMDDIKIPLMLDHLKLW